MERIAEKSGKTIDEAIASAAAELGVDSELCVIEVLEKPKSGFLGIGSTNALVRLTYSQSGRESAEAFLKGLLERMDITAEVESREEGEELSFEIKSENVGIIIGRRGDTLESIQHLTSLVCNKGEDKHRRCSVDTGGYRKKRDEALTELARKMASKAIKYRRNMVLEPMNSYSRHVIHAVLQDYPGVTTRSVGSDPNRRIVISVPGGERGDGGSRRSRSYK